MKKIINIFLLLSVLIMTSCYNLTETNLNPNGTPVENANPNLLMSTILTESAMLNLSFGFENMGPLMQHTQNIEHSSVNDYNMSGRGWEGYYSILNNNKVMYKIAVRDNLEFHQGVALVMKSFLYGQITDLYGDAPYTEALRASDDDPIITPIYDNQEIIYRGIIEDLKKAEGLLSKRASAYPGIYKETDVYYHGDPTKWRKFANSLLLRYYMRLSEKLPGFASDGIREIINNSKPIMEGIDDDAIMAYIGTNSSSSWPTNSHFDDPMKYNQTQMCGTLVDTLRSLSDPRLAIWAEPIAIKTVMDPAHNYAHNDTTSVPGTRFMHPEEVDMANINLNEDYVGIVKNLRYPYSYNYNDEPGPEGKNKYVSHLNKRYMKSDGPLLNAILMTSSEVNFILAEAAQRGWIGNAINYYNTAIELSFTYWSVGGDYAAYISKPAVAYDGTLERIMEQKWIASWSVEQESWCDYRRTGLPKLETGDNAIRPVYPLRFLYGSDELTENNIKCTDAISKLETTEYTRDDNLGEAFSRSWLYQGTNVPWQ